MKAALCLVVVLAFPAQSQAQADTPALTGAWIGKGPGASGGPDSKMRLDLIAPGGILQSNKLFGHVTEWPPPGDPQGTRIDEGKVTGNEVSFTVVNVLSKTTLKYRGTVSGSMIKGTVQVSRDGKTITHDWSVRRETPKKTTHLEEGSNLSLHWTGSSPFSLVWMAASGAAAPGQ
jgi:hypothetical protein